MTTTTQPTIEEFDNWTASDEQSALAAVSKNLTVKHIIRGDEFWALTPDHSVFKLPLNITFKDFQALSAVADTNEQVDQLRRILTAFAGAKQAKQLEEQPVQVLMNLLTDYGRCVSEAQGTEDMGK